LETDKETAVPQRSQDSHIHAELQEALTLIKQNSGNAAGINAKLDEVARKQDTIPSMLADLERRQNQALDTLRRDFERMFVSHAEYDPKHQILQDKMREYDRLIAESAPKQVELINLRASVNQHSEDIKDIQEQPAGTFSRLTVGVAIVISVLSFLLNFFQHVQIR
jgi:hypothetical protein